MEHTLDPVPAQLNFWGEVEIPQITTEDLPEDIQEKLRILSGDYLEEGGQLVRPEPPAGGQFAGESFHQTLFGDGKTARDRFLASMVKKDDPVTRFDRDQNHSIKVFDIAEDEQARELAELMDQIADPRNKMRASMKTSDPMLDPLAPRKFRVLVTVKCWKVVPDVIENRPVYDQVGGEKSA